MPRNQSVPRFLEFFAGAGLVRQGLMPHWQCVFANDNNPKKQAAYIDNFGSAEFCCRDVKELTAATLPDAEMAWASFPCQDLSLAGWQRGMIAARSGTFWAFWRLLRDLKATNRLPQVIVLENVVGVLQSKDFIGLCEALAALDLHFGALTIDARHFIPQSRPRVFFVATTNGFSPRLSSPGPTAPWSSTSLQRAVEGLPDNLRASWVWPKLGAPSKPVPLVDDLVCDSDARWYDGKQVAHLLEMMTPLHRSKLDAAMGSGRRKVGFLYRRRRDGVQRAEVRFDGLAGCLRTPVGGSSRQTVVVADAGRVQMRLLTAREAARLMGAPESFCLPSRYNTAYLAMGDGVCVPAVSWLSDQLLLPLANTRRGANDAEGRSQPSLGFLRQSERRADRWLKSV
jgi:DNA (cytosine-5)-methyltransferase 1